LQDTPVSARRCRPTAQSPAGKAGLFAEYCWKLPNIERNIKTVNRLQSVIQQRATESIGARIRRRRKELRLSQVELAAQANLNQGYVSQIERDLAHPRANTVKALAIALDIPDAVLIGSGPEHDTPQALDTRPLPLFGSVPAGPPSETQEQPELFPVLRHLWHADYYCLRLAFDSMEPTLKPGDIVLVHYRPDVNPEHVQGRICACLVDGTPTLKRISVEHRTGQATIILRGDNPAIPPLLVDRSQDFSIQGIVIRLVSREL
jgi:SOS-response transcriptional repressor LexA